MNYISNIESILEKVPEKALANKSTTSLKWKYDVLEYFSSLKIQTVLELGTNHGWTSYILSFIAQQVYTVELQPKNVQIAKKNCSQKSNIHFIQGSVFEDRTYKTVPQTVDVVVIDCVHQFNAVRADIKRALSFKHRRKPLYLVFDDYSHPNSPGVRQAVDEFLEQSKSTVEYIGQGKGFTVTRTNGTQFTLNGPEGLIIKLESNYEKH